MVMCEGGVVVGREVVLVGLLVVDEVDGDVSVEEVWVLLEDISRVWCGLWWIVGRVESGGMGWGGWCVVVEGFVVFMVGWLGVMV